MDLKTFLRELPPDARSSFAALFEAEPVGRTQLRDEVVAYVNLIRSTAATSDWIDVDTPKQIGRALLSLLKELGPDAGEFERRLVQAACRYFVLETDGEDDLDSEEGFEDDADVLNAVAEQLGREDLVIDTW